ncbi:hypothetical protein [Shewanella atlantica]|uniref:hypothetical protein n=1 Tax=Shewanella atlantica TaxID=271099 RepID=UPI003736C663
MIWSALALSASLFWIDIGSKQALVCELPSLQACLHRLPLSARHQLPDKPSGFNQLLGQRGAMVMAVEDRAIAGVIVLSPKNIPGSLSVNLSGSILSFPLEKTELMTLWHEAGHLEAIVLTDNGLIDELTPYSHEWLADCYLAWRAVKETGSLALIWQQYHRRNLAMMQSVTAISHWTVPVLSQLLGRYSAQQLSQFDTFNALMSEFLPLITVPDSDTLAEFSSLVHRTFSTEVSQALPDYMFWRKAELGRYLKPTLAELLGEKTAGDWLKERKMLTGDEGFHANSGH